MNMKKSLNSPATIFTLLQGITVLLSVLGVWVAGTLLYAGILALQAGYPAIGMPLGSYISLLTVGFLTVLTVSGACAVAMGTFFCLCGRLKKGTAFTRANEQAMNRIALCILIVGLTLLLACTALWIAERLWCYVMGLYWFQMLVVAVLCAAVALIARALALLVGRAVALQEEVDLTI